ncbi:MAG TPA: coproporphyrinogen dehydrogenase HemZ, partial [Firmicutes bacterium]|nr:coproporphyrinogen dehydrogenase HemZ [Bacillota bacterium]
MDFIADSYHYEKESFKIVAPKNLIPTIEAAVRSTVPNARFDGGKELKITTDWAAGLVVKAVLGDFKPQVLVDKEILAVKYDEEDRKRRQRERVRLAVLRVLEEAFDLAPAPWGILMGVRPVKMVHTLIDRGFTEEDIRRMLSSVYGVEPKKRDLLLEVARRQRGFFKLTPNQPIGVYIGIPFCPTRCSYCSFAAYPLKTHGHLFEGFLCALYSEITGVGRLLGDLGVKVESVYLGGGTPTTVQGRRLEKLLSLIQRYFISAETKELTVEAGRPETLNPETLQILRDYQVDRICINPQSMHDETLKKIGR